MIKPDITFALVQTFYRNGKTHYSAFLPLVVDCCLKSITNENIIITELQSKYEEMYGLNLPINVLRKILLIGVKQGFFTNNGEIFSKTQKLKESNIKKIQDEYIEKHESLINGFLIFYKNLKNKELCFEIAEKAMFSFMDENVYKLIKSYSTGTTLEHFNVDGAEEKIAFGRYIKKAIEDDNHTTINYLAEIAKGVMIHNAVYLPNEDSIERKFTDTYLIFDTPLVLSLLGYAGKERQKAVKELFDLAKSTDAKLAVFDFTVSEVISVLQNCAEAIRNKSFSYHGRSIEYFIEQKFTYEQIVVFIGRVEKEIKNKYSLEILHKNVDIKKQMMDERRLEECIDSIHQYQNRKAKLNDIDALAGVYNLRSGKDPYYLENSKAIFVTSNFLLIKAVHNYFKDERQNVDIAMTDFYMTNILWLKKPTKYPELPKKRAIADIYAALIPDDNLWSQFVHTLEEMQEKDEITYNDVISLQTAKETPELLMDASSKCANLLSPSSVQEIQKELDRIRLEAQREQQNAVMKKKADLIARVLSWILYLAVTIIIVYALITQTYSIMDIKNCSFIQNLKWIGTFILFLLSIGNIVAGITVGWLIKRTSSLLSKIIYMFLKKLVKVLTE